MARTFLTILLILLQIVVFAPLAHSEYEGIYHYYTEKGLDAFYNGNYEDAFFYFQTAHAIDPSRDKPLQYINLLKRVKEGHLVPAVPAAKGNDLFIPSPGGLVPTEKFFQQLTDEVSLLATAQILKGASTSPVDKIRIPSGVEGLTTGGAAAVTDDDVEAAVRQSLDRAVTDMGAKVSEQVFERIVLQAEPDVKRRVNAYFDQQKREAVSQPQLAVAPVEEKIPSSTAPSVSAPAVLAPSAQGYALAKVLPAPAPVYKEAVFAAENPNFKPKGPLAKQSIRRPITTARALANQKYDAHFRHLAGNEELKLNDALWKLRSRMTLELEIGKTVRITGKDITRFLSITEGILEITRVSKDQIRVKALRRGGTMLHIWEEHGRWTFNVICVYPSDIESNEQKYLTPDSGPPFRVEYSNSWSALHKGQSLGKMTRQNLTFSNWAGIYGETPYGKFDAFAQTAMFANSAEIVGQGIGLSNGHIGPFNDFTIRGYDSYKRLSDLTLAGRYFRGVLLDSYAFHHKLAYSYFHGQDQSVTLFSSIGNILKQSFVEGFKLTYDPDMSANYSFNYVRGYGPVRPKEFKDEVYSVQAQQKIRGAFVKSELAYDKTEYAFLMSSDLDQKDFSYNWNFRDINKNFQTIYGQPVYSGQIGSQLSMDWRPENYKISTYVDVYHDSKNPNPAQPSGVNFDASASFLKQLDKTSSWTTGLSYLTTPQTISPRQSFQLSNTYSKLFQVAGTHYLNTYLGQNYQWGRYKNTPSSDFDRYSLRAGFRVTLIKNLAYFFNYDYVWVNEALTKTWSNPKAFQTGINYNIPLTQSLFLDLDLNYQNESQDQSSFSFLAGQNSLSNSVSLTYHPTPDLQIYMDSQLRRVWPQHSSVAPYDDWNLMLGMRAGWDLPFRWNPTGLIRGIVYKDLNGNGVQDKDEPGMPGVTVIAGKFETVTNDDGEYELKVTAKKAAVSLDLKTVPQGFIFSTALSKDALILQDKPAIVNFGLSSRSGIYGVAYADENGDGKPDRGDRFFSNIVVRLDDGDITQTDGSGSYFFEDIKPGRHTIKIDVNSIPLEYSPTVRVVYTIDLKEGTTYVYNIPLKKNPA